nr:M23 family metallopeptidase [Deltaproteobacteria bacterium]
MGELARCPEFETELTWQDLPGAASAPGCAPGDWGSIQEAAWGYSMFRAEGNDSPELVVYALQATTPLWFGKPVQYVVHDGTVVARSRFPLGAPFMVSRAEGSGSGGVNDGGRDFGKFVPKLNPKPAPPTNCTPAQAAKWNANSHGSEQIRREVLDQGPPELARWRPHEGIDLVGLEGVTPVFSICAGVVLHIDETGGYGHEVIIALRPRVAGRPERMIRYAHLAARSHLSKNQLVIPGTLLGLVGRTSKVPPVVQTDFYGPRSPTHLHIELREASRMGRPDEVRRLFDGSPVAPHIPEWLLPGNDLPRVLPCDCEKGTLNPRSCRRRGDTSTPSRRRAGSVGTNRICVPIRSDDHLPNERNAPERSQWLTTACLLRPLSRSSSASPPAASTRPSASSASTSLRPSPSPSPAWSRSPPRPTPCRARTSSARPPPSPSTAASSSAPSMASSPPSKTVAPRRITASSRWCSSPSSGCSPSAAPTASSRTSTPSPS